MRKLDIAEIRERAGKALDMGNSMPYPDQGKGNAADDILSLCDALEEAVKGMCGPEDNCEECNEKLARVSAKLKGGSPFSEWDEARKSGLLRAVEIGKQVGMECFDPDGGCEMDGEKAVHDEYCKAYRDGADEAVRRIRKAAEG